MGVQILTVLVYVLYATVLLVCVSPLAILMVSERNKNNRRKDLEDVGSEYGIPQHDGKPFITTEYKVIK